MIISPCHYPYWILMMDRQYFDHIAFRILFPFITGMILYLTMLMVFDSLDQIGDIFFSQEAAFVVIMTYLNHEWAIFLMKRVKQNVILYFLILLSSAILINSAVIALYFIYMLGYTQFRTELITLNILFVLFHTMVSLYYLSIRNMSRLRDISLQREEDLGKQLELELESFKNEMNPSLLMTCLETLLNLVHLDVPEADKYILVLSNQYRYILDQRQKEFTDLDKELEAAGELVYLLGYDVQKSLLLETDIEKGTRLQIIPGTLLYIINWIFNQMIIRPMRPVTISISLDQEQNVRVTHGQQLKLSREVDSHPALEKLNLSYVHYTGSEITSNGQNGIWVIPRIPDIKEGE